MAKPYKTVKNHFGRQTPKIKQIFCWHKYEMGREFMYGNRGAFCVYLKCSKCGKFKRIDYFKG